MWIVIRDDNRIKESLNGNGFLERGLEIQTPDGFDTERQFDWKLIDGVLVYEPEQV